MRDVQDGIPKFKKREKSTPPAAPGTGFAGEEKKGAPGARPARRGPLFFALQSKKNLREKKGIFRGRPFAPGRGAWSFWRAKGAVAGCALPKGRGKKPGAPRRGGGPHRPGGADCPAGPGAGGPAEKGAGGGKAGRGRVCRSREKGPRPGGARRRGAGAVRGGVRGRRAGERRGAKGGGAGPEPCRGFGERAEGGALASSTGEKGERGGRVREKAPRGGSKALPPCGGWEAKKRGAPVRGARTGALAAARPKGGARAGEKGGRQRIRP